MATYICAAAPLAHAAATSETVKRYWSRVWFMWRYSKCPHLYLLPFYTWHNDSSDCNWQRERELSDSYLLVGTAASRPDWLLNLRPTSLIISGQGYMLVSCNFNIALTVDGSGRRSVFLTTPLNSAAARHFRTTHAHSVCRRFGARHSSASARRVPSSSRRETQCGGTPTPFPVPLPPLHAANQIRSTLGSAPQASSSAMRGVLAQVQWP